MCSVETIVSLKRTAPCSLGVWEDAVQQCWAVAMRQHHVIRVTHPVSWVARKFRRHIFLSHPVDKTPLLGLVSYRTLFVHTVIIKWVLPNRVLKIF